MMKTYGKKINAEQIQKVLAHQVQTNRSLQRRGLPGIPLCIWGTHGIGKTEIVRSFARQKAWKFRSVSPAQFEEMGDLIGMPAIEQGRTVLRKPDWAPEDFGPGILLLDDFNRADLRILRGMMPLLQDGRLISWALPTDWHIVLTANPDYGDYRVTPLDEAMLTRMMHVEMIFDLPAWLRWADRSRIPAVLSDFALLFPDTLHSRTTPRTLTQFFTGVQALDHWEQQPDMLAILAEGYLDPDTALAFMRYIQARKWRLPSPGDLLASKDFSNEVRPRIAYLLEQDPMRLDVLGVLWERLFRIIKKQTEPLNDRALVNLATFLKIEKIPADIRKAWILRLMELDQPELERMFAGPEWASILL